MVRLLILASSLVKLVTALAVMALGLRAGWQLTTDLQPLEKVPVLMTVLLATFPPIGFFLYFKYWEEKPPLSAACFSQAILGTVSIVIFQVINHYTPLMPAW